MPVHAPLHAAAARLGLRGWSRPSSGVHEAGVARPGCFVLLRDLDTGQCESWELVDDAKSDLSHGLLSAHDAIGKLIVGRRRGDRVEYRSGFGRRRLQLLVVDSDSAW